MPRQRKKSREETETAPYYMRAEVGMRDAPSYAILFSVIEHLSYFDGVVDTNCVDEGNLTKALRLLEKNFRNQGISCTACYADYLINQSFPSLVIGDGNLLSRTNH